jgi:2,3-bisphosphoglycerate-dependent phosphoglycerate mutase
MARLIAALIRHGDYRQRPGTPSAHQPYPLNAEGEAQAARAADAVRTEAEGQGWRLIDSIDSSQLLRAWQTARIIGFALNANREPLIEGFDALAERGLGSAANLNLDEIAAVLREDPRFPEPPPDWKADSHYRLPLQGAESLLDAGERVATHLRMRMQALRGRLEADSLKLFVGHGAAFRHAAYRLGVLQFDDIARLSMYHASPVYLEFRDDGSWHQVAGEWKLRARGSEFTD